MSDFLFGTAGVPITVENGDTISGIKEISVLGLDAMELEWVHGVRMKPEKCDEFREAGKTHRVSLSAHAPYYINLASLETEKIEASIGRIVKSAVLGERAGATDIVFHPAFLMKRERIEVEKLVFEAYADVIKRYENEGLSVSLRPELTGKESAYGNLEEVIKMSKEFPHTLPCIDWAHLHARTGGAWNSYNEWCTALEMIGDGIGEERGLRRMHIHLSGIEYTPKGERKHLPLKESDLKYRELLRALKQFGCGGRIICESPHAIMHEDALLIKRSYARVRISSRK
ncbi:TIM barrel protein [bacterium]|nr:TIM barrel protein [bacterium]